jgi:peptidoglycan hydrolase CwlO-like protein
MSLNDVMPLLVALVGASGAWAFLTKKSEQRYLEAKEDREHRAEFNVTLKTQVDRLSDKVDALLEDKENLLKEIAALRAELGEARATIKHLETMLMSK